MESRASVKDSSVLACAKSIEGLYVRSGPVFRVLCRRTSRCCRLWKLASSIRVSAFCFHDPPFRGSTWSERVCLSGFCRSTKGKRKCREKKWSRERLGRGGRERGRRRRRRSFVVFFQPFSSFYGIVLAHCAIFPWKTRASWKRGGVGRRTVIGVEKETDEGKEVECCKRTEEKEKDSVRQKLIRKTYIKNTKKYRVRDWHLRKSLFPNWDCRRVPSIMYY